MKNFFKNKFFILLTLLVFAVAAIGGLSGCKQDNISISLDNDNISLKIGENIKINAEVMGIDEYEILWQSGDGSVAGVNGEGFVTGLSKGETIITASVGNKKAECRVTITDQIEFTVTGQNFMYVGNTIDLYVSLTVNGEAALPDNVAFSIVSGAEYIALSGNSVTGVSEGTSVVRAEHPVFNLSADYTVRVSEIIDLHFTEKRVVFTTSDLASIKTVVLDIQAFKGGSAVSAADITWESLDTSIAAVNEGIVTFFMGGEVMITATYGNVTENCVVICKNYEGCTPLYNASDFKAIAGDLGGKYVLMEDIDLNSDGQTGLNFQISAAAFTGTLEGNGKTVYGYSNTAGSWNNGIFRIVKGLVRNLTVLADVYYTGNSAGVLANTVQPGGIVDNVFVYAERIIRDAAKPTYGSGVLVGLNYGGTIRNSVVSGNYDAVASAGNTGLFVHVTNSIINSGVVPVISNCYSIINNGPADMLTPTVYGGVKGLTPEYFSTVTVEIQNLFAVGAGKFGNYFVSYEIADDTKAEFVEDSILGLQEGSTKLYIRFADPNGKVLGANDVAAYLEIPVNIVGSLPPPANVRTDGTYVLWDAVPGAIGYDISVQYENDAAQTFDISGGSVLSYDISSLLTDSGAYKIKVRTLSTGIYGEEYVINAVKTRAQFAAIGTDEDSLAKKYILIDDINLNVGGTGLNFQISAAAFTGTLDGNGKTVYGYSNTAGSWGNGIFVRLEGLISNLTVLADTYHTGNSSGILAGSVLPGGIVDNVYIYAERIIKNASTAQYGSGLLAGLNYGGIIRNSVASGNYDVVASGTNTGKFVHISNTVTNNGVVPSIINCFSIINNGPDDMLMPGVGEVTGYRPVFEEISVAKDDNFTLAYVLDGKTLTYSMESNTFAMLSADGEQVVGLSAGTAVLRISIAGIAANGVTAYIDVPVAVE